MKRQNSGGGEGNLAAFAVFILTFVLTIWGGSALAAGPAQGELWGKQCEKSPDGKTELCSVRQFVMAQPGNRMLLLVLFNYGGAEGKPRLILDAPLGIDLPPGLTLTIDGNKPIALPFMLCDNGGCRSVIDMDAPALDQFRNGKAMVIRYVAGGRPVDLPVKLEGLSASLKSIAP